MDRIASVRADIAETSTPTAPPASHRLAGALLAGSPRVALAGHDLCRVDARGWTRRGGEMALARALQEAASGAGFSQVTVGIADLAVAADAACRLAAEVPEPRHPGALFWMPGAVIVAPGASRRFLAPLPLRFLPLPEELRETFGALGFRHVGDLAGRGRSELEARFGSAGIRAHRLACGEDDRAFRPLAQTSLPEASLELEGAADTLEPLLFVLRNLLDRVCADLEGIALCATRLCLDLYLEDGMRKRASVVPARPTRRENLLYDLCRASLERAVGEGGRLPAPVSGVVLRVEKAAAPEARQGDLFAGEWRDPMAAAAALSRLRARIGDEGVVSPWVRPDHRPETRNAWRPTVLSLHARETSGTSAACPDPCRGTVPAPGAGPRGWQAAGMPPGILRLLPEPVAVRVRFEGGRPMEVEGPEGRHLLVAAEGPERLSGDWWKDPYHREYFRVCTVEGELLWLFREYRRNGELRWWMHGWWD